MSIHAINIVIMMKVQNAFFFLALLLLFILETILCNLSYLALLYILIFIKKRAGKSIPTPKMNSLVLEYSNNEFL